MHSRLRLLVWQIDVIAYEHSENPDARPGGARDHVAKSESGGRRDRYERVRFSPVSQTNGKHQVPRS